ncbi:conserved hypothetical protein [Ricinus communis]|uniref:Uncharacterized protein n=1 Tax=Ricinus communis TaxID=3988 RepID=B9S515_RICCO|nr:conserved hypothetical protein [Ricinus communis]
MEMMKCIKNGTIYVYVEAIEIVEELGREGDARVNIQCEINIANPDEASTIGVRLQEKSQATLLVEIEYDDPDYKPLQVSDTNDGMSGGDFSSEDKEHLEARRDLKWARMHEFDNNEPTNAPLRAKHRSNQEHVTKMVEKAHKGQDTQ